MNIIGIDPGLDGALAIIEEPVRWDLPPQIEPMAWDTPTRTVEVARGTKREYKLDVMAEWLRPWAERHRSYGDVAAFIENVHSMPGQGVRSMFSMGYGVGAWHGILSALKIPYTLVTPQSWKKAMIPDPHQKDKDASRLVAMNLFPSRAVLFERKRDHGRADAVLIAEYGRRRRGAAVVV